jgi:CBS domain-containing protein
MRACDVMTTNVISVREDTPVEDIARTLLEHRISAVPVLDRLGRLTGIVSEGDLLRRPESQTERPGAWWLGLLAAPEERAAGYVKSHGRQAKDVMTRSVVTVGETTTLEQVVDLLERHRIKRVPVLSGDKLVGIVSRANLLHGLATARTGEPVTADDETIRAAVLETISAEAGVRDEFINVLVADGTVHLWGAAESEEERDAVRVAVENTTGVRAIDDHLAVFPAQVRTMLWAE